LPYAIETISGSLEIDTDIVSARPPCIETEVNSQLLPNSHIACAAMAVLENVRCPEVVG
jgi:hypothetical protein